MFKKTGLLVVILCAVVATGCGQNHSVEFAEADELFKKKSYRACLNVLEDVRSRDPNAQYSGYMTKESTPVDKIIDDVQSIIEMEASADAAERSMEVLDRVFDETERNIEMIERQ